MIHTLAFIKRRAAIDREAFREHYEKIHVPLALPLLEGLLRYVRYHVESIRYGEFGFDVMTAFGYRDKKTTDRVFARLAADEGAAIRADELDFMDKPANRFVAISERLFVPERDGGAVDEEAFDDGRCGAEALFVLVTRPEGVRRFEASSRLGVEHWPRLLARVERPRRALLRDVFPMPGPTLAYDGILQIEAEGFAGLDRWARGLEAEGYRVCAVRTRRFETRLDD